MTVDIGPAMTAREKVHMISTRKMKDYEGLIRIVSLDGKPIIDQ